MFPWGLFKKSVLKYILAHSKKTLTYADIKLYAKYKASDCSKIRPDMPNLLFFVSSLWNQQNFRSSYFWLHLIVWSACALQQYSCKTRCLQKNICCRVHSYCNLNFKIFKWKVKINAVYGNVYSPVKVFLIQWISCFCSAFNFFPEWFNCKEQVIFIFYKKKTAWQFDVRSHMTQDLGNTHNLYILTGENLT